MDKEGKDAIDWFWQKIKDMKDELTCSICLEQFKDPTFVVPCGHIFCKTCLNDSIMSKESPLCPFCWEPVDDMCPIKEITTFTTKLKEALIAINPVEHILSKYIN